MGQQIRSQISRRLAAVMVLFLCISFAFCCTALVRFGGLYSRALSESAARFAGITIDADSAKDYITTRKSDDGYRLTLRRLTDYTDSIDGVLAIRMVSYSDSTGYYIYDTDGSTLGTRLPYGTYETSVKADLINGLSSWSRTAGTVCYTYLPLRTVDDRLAGYVIIETDNSFAWRWGIAAAVILLLLVVLALLFVRMQTTFVEREVFLPVRQLAREAMGFASSVSNNQTINAEALFELDKDNEIGYLSKAIQQMVSDINNSTEDLHKAIFSANHDSMTQVFNKRRYNEMISTFRESESVCVIYFDVNNLKLMNDTLGHERGDFVIRTAADYIRRLTAPFEETEVGAYCFRMGGDEFLLVLTNCALRHIDRLIVQLDNDAPFILSSEEDSVKCALSYGYAYAKGGFSYENLLAEAEDRMYEKKKELKELLDMPDR